MHKTIVSLQEELNLKDEEWNTRHGYTYFHFGWVLPALGIFLVIGIIVIPMPYYLNFSAKVIVVLAWILAFAIFGGFMTVLTATLFFIANKVVQLSSWWARKRDVNVSSWLASHQAGNATELANYLLTIDKGSRRAQRRFPSLGLSGSARIRYFRTLISQHMSKSEAEDWLDYLDLRYENGLLRWVASLMSVFLGFAITAYQNVPGFVAKLFKKGVLQNGLPHSYYVVLGWLALSIFFVEMPIVIWIVQSREARLSKQLHSMLKAYVKKTN